MTTVDECRLVDLPHLSFEEGSITPVEGPGREVPFEIRRAFYVYDVVGGAVRGGHAHKELEQFIVAVMGGFTVVLWDGEREREVELNRAYYGLYVPPPIWTDLVNFSSGAVVIVLASDHYDEADYIRGRDDFVGYRRTLARSA
jgi:dTDP-4-dehydrorhamnose 3,5-epimerase-like enzyme